MRSRSSSLPPVPSMDTILQLGKAKATIGMSIGNGTGVGGSSLTIEEGEEDEEVDNELHNGAHNSAHNNTHNSIHSTHHNTHNESIPVDSDDPKSHSHSKLSQGLILSKQYSHVINEEKDPIGSELTRSLSVSAANLGKYSDRSNSISPSSSRRTSWFHNLSSKFGSHNSVGGGSSGVGIGINTNSPSNQQTKRASVSSISSVKSNASRNSEENPQTTHTPITNGINSHAPIFSPSYTNNRNLPTNRILDTHPPRTSSPKLSPEIAIGGTSLSPTSPINITKTEHNRTNSVSNAGSLVNRLRRLSTRSSNQNDSVTSLESTQRIILNKNNSKKPPKLPELQGMLPPRVRFSSEVFENDPPQQIPARNPRTGNITFGPNGEINRDPLPSNPNGYPIPSYILPRNYSASTLAASQSAYESAIRVANSVKSPGGVSIFKSKNSASSTNSLGSINSATDDDDKDITASSGRSQSLKIDKPMHSERMGSGSGPGGASIGTTGGDSSLEDDESDQEKELTLEVIYTRCCHLREILPIAATMKQIKDRKPPLEVIKMMNPRPTLIEILSLSDFLSVVPVRMLIFDNVSLSTEMLRITLSSVLTSKHLERLSFRNLTLDSKGWKIFCAFFSENTSITKLDLSTQRQNSKQPLDRSSLDWSLLTKALIARGGVEELLLNGCMVPSGELANLILKGCSLSTKRLGIALNDLLIEDTEVIMKWAEDPNCVCEGLDLGGNSLDQSWDAIKEILKGSCLKYLSLNSTGLANVAKANEIFGGVCSHSNLRMLDISSNPDLFPKFTHVLAAMLPKFSDLRRVHLDSNNLSSEDVMLLADSFARCPKLVHISLLDNRRLDATACAALAVATHISNTIYTVETDSDLWPVILQRRLTHNCLVNMELIAGRISKHYKEEDDEGWFGKEDIVNTGNYVAMAAGELLKSIKEDGDNDAEGVQGHLVVSEMVRRAKQVRVGIRKTMDELFEKRRSDIGLSIEEKEKLVRLCFLDGTLEKVLDKYNQTVQSKLQKQLHKNHTVSATPSVTNNIGDNGNGTNSTSVIEACGDIITTAGAKSKDIGVHLLPLLPDDRNIALSTPNPAHPDLAIAPVSENEEIKSLSRRSSVTSLHRKEQELEEGELHKFGTFIRSHRDSHTDVNADEEFGSDEDDDEASDAGNEEVEINTSTGEELRRKILEAKGSQSVSELIQQLQQMHGPELDRILKSGTLSEKEDILGGGIGKNDDRAVKVSKAPIMTSSGGLGDEDYETLDSVVDDIARAFT